MSRHGVLPDEEDMIDLPPYISPATLLPKVRAYEMAGGEHAKGLGARKIVEGAIGNLSREALPGPMYGFQELGLAEAVLHNLARCHFETPSPLQCYSIPMVLAGRDLLVCAHKGSGKTTDRHVQLAV